MALRSFWSGVDHSNGNTARWKWRSHLASIHRTVRLSERHFSRLGNAAIINDELILAMKQLRDFPEVNATGRSCSYACRLYPVIIKIVDRLGQLHGINDN